MENQTNDRIYDGLGILGKKDPSQVGLLGGILVTAGWSYGFYQGMSNFQEDWGQFLAGTCAILGVCQIVSVIPDIYKMLRSHKTDKKDKSGLSSKL